MAQAPRPRPRRPRRPQGHRARTVRELLISTDFSDTTLTAGELLERSKREEAHLTEAALERIERLKAQADSPGRETARWLVDKDLELYRAGMDITLRATTFVLAISGGVVSYYLANQEDRLLVWALLMPLLMSGMFFVLALFSIFVAAEMRRRHEVHSRAAGMDEPYDIGPLWAMVLFSSIILFFTTAGLGFLFLRGLRPLLAGG